ncbi:hypothetical protein [Dyella agri]|uniref:Uncharacterized protein n=1 Tax=Dyella agri TaxID=1926869 RepID=A0ABW8KHV4_9GAMM
MAVHRRPLRLRAEIQQAAGTRLLSGAASVVLMDKLRLNPHPGAIFGADITHLPTC